VWDGGGGDNDEDEDEAIMGFLTYYTLTRILRE
jgi:hypothetical protein